MNSTDPPFERPAGRPGGGSGEGAPPPGPPAGPPTGSHGHDDEALSAYLDGELDEAQAAALEQRLAEDPALRRRLDALADVLVALRGLDDVEPPAGFAENLSERLRTELGHGAPAGAQPSSPAAAAAPASTAAGDDLAARRARRSQRSGTGINWAALSGIAAVIVAVGVVAIGGFGAPGGDDSISEVALEDGDEAAGGGDVEVLRDKSPGGGTEMLRDDLGPPAAMEEADGEAAAGSAAREQDADAAGDTGVAGDTGTGAEQDAGEPGIAAAPTGPAPPVIVDAGLEVGDAEELSAAYADLPEVDEVLGLDVGEAEERAAANAMAIREAEALPGSGLRPAACLDTVTAEAQGPLVPVRVEALRYQDEPSLAYVLVGARGDSSTLDRVEVWVVDPTTCATRQRLALDRP